MSAPLPDASLDQLFREARSYNAWKTEPLPETLLRAVYDLARMGPTSANCSPARFVFCTSAESREKLASLASATNGAKIRQAPCTVIIGHDLEFMDRIPELFPHNPGAKDWFPKGSDLAERTAFRNGTLQGAYLILAARSLGLDCGPMSGFANDKVDEAFFAGTTVKSNFICSLGHGTDENLFPRSPRLTFEDACRIA
ncbi:malonic semialdehyde reductase [Caulobacter sp. SLTY]|uniref:malonic semialdehyde reductase n=1 Tax=Caulobacter sp. SLTY TaxID=2683262 RepID=UPI0014134248|nr:malonic semialdehyde reductase [Caulobacter sp. SLTY]NBB13786.1 malonic semialdehyde reductase [Caulobacter sp. SLTY]